MEQLLGHSLKCIVVTPERAVLDEAADFVALPMFDGELGVLPGRAPLIGRLGFGELRTRHGGQIHRYFIDGGFAQVRANVVTVLTARAQKAEEIDVPGTERVIQEARTPGHTPEELEAKLKTQERARAKLRVAHRASGSAAAAH